MRAQPKIEFDRGRLRVTSDHQDSVDNPRGAAWDNAIEREIRACSTMLVVLSHVAVASNNVRDEIAFAKDEGKRIVPIMIENCPLPIALRRIQYIDFTGDRVRALAELHAALLSGPVAESPALQPHRFRALPVKPTPRPVRIALGWALLAGLLLGTGLASVFWMRGVQTGTADRRLVSPGAATASLGGGFMETCVDIIRGPVVSAVEPALPPAAQEAFAIVTESEADQRKARNLRLVAPLFSEEIHVLACRQVAGLRDLQGARVAAGPPGLGSRFTAERLFSGLEIRPQWLDLGPEQGVCAVLAGQADAMVYVAGKPVSFSARLTQLRERFPDAPKRRLAAERADRRAAAGLRPRRDFCARLPVACGTHRDPGHERASGELPLRSRHQPLPGPPLQATQPARRDPAQ